MSSNESWAATPSFGSNLHRWGQNLWFLKPFAHNADRHSSKGLTFWKTEWHKLQHHGKTNDLRAGFKVAKW